MNLAKFYLVKILIILFQFIKYYLYFIYYLKFKYLIKLSIIYIYFFSL